MVVNMLGIPQRNQNLPEVKNRTSHPDWACTFWVLSSAPCKISQCVRHPHWNCQQIIFIDNHITWWSYKTIAFVKQKTKNTVWLCMWHWYSNTVLYRPEKFSKSLFYVQIRLDTRLYIMHNILYIPLNCIIHVLVSGIKTKKAW